MITFIALSLMLLMLLNERQHPLNDERRLWLLRIVECYNFDISQANINITID